MSTLLPSEENITRLKVQPTLGEKHLLSFLKDLLPNNYEIYYQPFLNGDRPDIIIMRKNFKVMLIEVKDWDLDSYYIDPNKKLRLKHNNSIIKSPIEQVKAYKDNLYNLHIENLLEKKWIIINFLVLFLVQFTFTIKIKRH
ncbi:MAG: nuclease-related domain-containing protein [Nostoc sp.]